MTYKGIKLQSKTMKSGLINN